MLGQTLEGIPWGLFIANAPAYSSEVVPIKLRSTVLATLQMSWSLGKPSYFRDETDFYTDTRIGSVIVAAVTYAYNGRDDQWSWRLPMALQWIFPVS